MTRGTVTSDEIAMVRAALAGLRGLKPFRGQAVLVRDAEEHLAAMMAAQGAGHADPDWLPDSSELESRVAQRTPEDA